MGIEDGMRGGKSEKKDDRIFNATYIDVPFFYPNSCQSMNF